MKRKMRILIITVFTLASLVAATLVIYLPARKIEIHSPTEDFTAYLDIRIPKLMRIYKIPGASIALVRDGQIVYTAAYGVANQKRIKMTVDMPMRVQSISKSVTAWAVLKLAQRESLI